MNLIYAWLFWGALVFAIAWLVKGRPVAGVVMGLCMSIFGLIFVWFLKDHRFRCKLCGGIVTRGFTVCKHCGKPLEIIGPVKASAGAKPTSAHTSTSQ